MTSFAKYFLIVFLTFSPFGSMTWAFEDDLLGDGTGEQFGFVPNRSWQEGDFALPPMPSEKNLILVKIFEMPQYRYFIDQRSLNVSANDNVARYTIVIMPPSGLRNVFYEGIRCDTNEYKIYATALWGEQFNAIANSKWNAIVDKGVNVYRHDLFKYFLCHNSLIKANKKDILQALRYPPDNFIEDELE